MPALPHDPIQTRSTKIVATIGNVSSDPAKLRQLHDAGVNVFRLNFSHGTQADQGARIDAIRAMEADTGIPTCILADCTARFLESSLMGQCQPLPSLQAPPCVLHG